MSKDQQTAMRAKSPVASLFAAANAVNGRLASIPRSLPLLVLRIAAALPFWNSGVLKWETFPVAVNRSAIFLFAEEFKLHAFGYVIDYPYPALTAHLVAMAEVAFAALLVVGLATRGAALALVFMTAVIQLTIPDGWPTHLTWFSMAFAVMVFGPGRIALDAWFGRDVRATPKRSPTAHSS